MANKGTWWKFNQHHCEKTSFFTAFMITLIAISAYYAVQKGTIVFGNDLIWLFGLSAIAGEFGILYYRYEGGKSLLPIGIVLILTILAFISVPMFKSDTIITCFVAPCPQHFISIIDMTVGYSV